MCSTILNGGYLVIMQKKLSQGIGGITTRKQERLVCTEINIVLGKNEGYMPSTLGGRSISVGRQIVRQKFLQFDNFNSVCKAQLSCLIRFMVLIARQKEIYGLYIFERNIIVRLFSKQFFIPLKAIVFLVNSYFQVLTYLMILGSFYIYYGFSFYHKGHQKLSSISQLHCIAI